MPKKLKYLLRWVALPVGIVIFAVGLVTFPLPLPTGLILMVVGLTVMAINPLVLRWVKRTRPRFPELNAKIRSITPHMPTFVRRFLSRTDSQQKRQKPKLDH
ncbi:MAG: hypothetical protein JJ960_00715 [Kordiimonadaceae bacterium]|nr:hypothetical protein [Kordiimonadaceae bacterium]MBO6567230.1 hypothetical protein [Kordiimonadaceae bacterium]